jgi:hypothetical protein
MNRSATICILIPLHRMRNNGGSRVGNELTYKIFTQKQRDIYRSAIRSAMDPAKQNQSLSPLGGEPVSNYLGD